ncbi:hypothetical protein K488DRAFT_61896 [Vararia minispora EC-137]|uniref:Uncharacterized protein n=1 Tax=Vararia minispora EC-137 TaxID=1314806 RepID=A0ACB8Q7F5_9AGAM|nr:hypothetical protein K488DRAFT_61896 [Vararia minispora EC-137]
MTGRVLTPAERRLVEGRLWSKPVVDHYPGPAGVPISSSQPHGEFSYEERRQAMDATHSSTNIWAPFRSGLEWKLALWAKTRGPSSTALSELLEIDDIPRRLDLSFKNAKELNTIIDKHLPKRPKFQLHKIVIGNETFELYMRDIIPCIRSLFGDPELSKHLLLAPERHYSDADRTLRIYCEMNTGKWWWSAQAAVEASLPGATIVPLIFSSDKTQLTVFGNKTAYPVYVTIGNIPKDIRSKPSRRAQILVAYLPTSKLDTITNKAARRRTLANLFHECMRQIVAPLKSAGVTGVAMARGDGVWHQCHPLYVTFVGDYPEQVLVASTISGDCPKCIVPHAALGDSTDYPLRDLASVLDVFDLQDGHPTVFHAACKDARLKPTFHPFWEDLPFTNIYLSITPDILHQMFQGVVKHLVTWLIETFGKEEIDARCRCMPPNHNARLFTKGISSLTRVTGTEHKDMCRILLALVVDLPLPNGASSKVVRAVRALLDFVYL